MTFDVPPELVQFAESVRAAISGWTPQREPELGEWQDDRDDELAARLAEAGWSELWASEDLLGAVVAGGFELGRAAAPLSLVDEPTLGAPLSVGGRARHARGIAAVAVPRRGGGLALATPTDGGRAEPTLDGTGTAVAAMADVEPLPADEADARWHVWTAAMLGYLAGLADAALEATATHARSREQFGRPLSAMPAIQARLADAALARDGLVLTAWGAVADGSEMRRAPALLWAGSAAREVTATAHQVHGAVGFALETGIHRFHRRAKAVQVWAAAVCDACAER